MKEYEWITIRKSDLDKLIRLNIACHYGKNISTGFIDHISLQIVENIIFFMHEELEELYKNQ